MIKCTFYNKDLHKSKNGILQNCSDIDMIIRRAIIRLSIDKGKYVFDKSLGNEFYSHDLSRLDNNSIFILVSEALFDIKEIVVTKVERVKTDNDFSLAIKIYAEILNDNYEIYFEREAN
ncbi:MAG: hypothetical protein RSE93_01150 [Oscillospiraceae bacterium]